MDATRGLVVTVDHGNGLHPQGIEIGAIPRHELTSLLLGELKVRRIHPGEEQPEDRHLRRHGSVCLLGAPSGQYRRHGERTSC